MANIGFDWYNKYILHDETDTAIDVIEVYSKAKDEEDFAHVGMSDDIIMTATGKDILGGGKFTGVTSTLRNNWTYKCRTIPISDITIKISGGNTIAESGNPVFTHVDNVHYEIDQSTSPALISGGGSGLTDQETRDAMTLQTSDPILVGSIDYKLDNIRGGRSLDR